LRVELLVTLDAGAASDLLENGRHPDVEAVRHGDDLQSLRRGVGGVEAGEWRAQGEAGEQKEEAAFHGAGWRSGLARLRTKSTNSCHWGARIGVSQLTDPYAKREFSVIRRMWSGGGNGVSGGKQKPRTL
jgi:hypothetical protein